MPKKKGSERKREAARVNLTSANKAKLLRRKVRGVCSFLDHLSGQDVVLEGDGHKEVTNAVVVVSWPSQSQGTRPTDNAF